MDIQMSQFNQIDIKHISDLKRITNLYNQHQNIVCHIFI